MAERKANHNLFPPIVDSYMPSFAVEDEQCQISFQVSDYNSITEIAGAEVSVRFQSSNTSALKDKAEFLSNLNEEQEENFALDLDNGIIILPKSILSKEEFEPNIIYKVQIRFTDSKNDYSEWSTVCLIKGIQKPILTVPLFEDSDAIGDMVVNTGTIEVQASVSNLEEEIYYYEMYLYNQDGSIFEHSGKIYTTDENDTNLKHTFKKQLEVNKNYKLEISFCTTSYYVFEKEYNFVHTLIDEQLDIEILLQENNENGYIEAAVPLENLRPGSYIILRASSLDDFNTWKDLHQFQREMDDNTKTTILREIEKENETIKIKSLMSNDNNMEEVEGQFYIYKDYTVQSGVLYKYKIQNYGKGGIRSLDSRESAAAACYFDHLFLGNKDFQLKIKYDSSVASLKKNILESKTDTLGGQYPIIRRNGNMKYESFSVSGLIAIFGDENEFYDDSWKQDDLWQKKFYNKYNITDMNDFIGEKAYRDKVSEFLHDGQVKLFRSTQEGNFLVRLMDISLTPNTQLGRMLYSFSATAYQIADLTVENYFKYNIIDDIVYNVEQDIVSREYVFGQEVINEYLMKTLQNKYAGQYTYDNYIVQTSLTIPLKKLKIKALKDTLLTINNKEVSLLTGHEIILKDEDTVELSKASVVLVEYEGELKLSYLQDYYKTQYLSSNIGQLDNVSTEIIQAIKEEYNDGIKDLYHQEIEKIDAIHFYNYNSGNVELSLVYEDTYYNEENESYENVSTTIVLGSQEEYLLTSDVLETKAIKLITPNQPVYIDYYYTLSKKYYFN